MKLITFNDITALNISPETCLDWVSEMILNKSSVLLPPKISMKPLDGSFCNVMPSIVPLDGKRYGGIKVVTRYPNRVPSLDSMLILFDAESGEFLSLMDANWITAMRTGAVATHSIQLLAKKDFSTVGIIGLGNTARATLHILSAVMPDKALHIKLLRYKGQEDLFVRRFAETPHHFEFVNSYEDVVRGSDVVLSAATYFDGDICPDDCFDEGVLIVPIHTRGFTNCDLFFDKVFADDYGHVHHFKNFDKFRSFSEVSDVVNGRKAGRESDRERILAYNIGLSMHDIFYAAHLYQIIHKSDLQDFSLCAPEEKFWL